MFTKRPICVVLLAVMAPVPAWVGSAVASYTSQGRAAPSPYTAGQDEAVKADESDLNQRLDQIEAKIERLEASSDERWLTDKRTSEIRALVEDLLAVADTWADLLPTSLTAGYDGEFFIVSNDHRFRLELSGQIQQRYVLNQQNNAPTDDTRGGFELRRAKLKVAGYLWDRRWPIPRPLRTTAQRVPLSFRIPRYEYA